MPSDFFDRLRDARRIDISPTPSGEPAEISFDPLTPEDGRPFVCTACGATVAESRLGQHEGWHAEQSV